MALEIYGAEASQIAIVIDVGSTSLMAGAYLLLCFDSGQMVPRVIEATRLLSHLTVGMLLESREQGLLQVRWLTWLPESCGPAQRAAWVVVKTSLPPGINRLCIRKNGTSLAWITLSDKASIGAREDTSGPAIEAIVTRRLELAYTVGFVLPDESSALRSLLVQLALEQGVDLVFTTGGTGVAPRDTTPEAVLSVIEKRLPGFEGAMLAMSLAKTSRAMLSRVVVGTLGRTLIITLPGSSEAVVEMLDVILPAIPHCLAKLQGDPVDCGTAS